MCFRRNASHLFVIGPLAVIGTLGPTVASATIDGVDGQVEKIAPPASVKLGQLESDTVMRAFDEQQNVVLTKNLRVNITEPGTYDDFEDVEDGVVPAGTAVSSHFVHIDPVKKHGIVLDGTIHVDGVILGIAVLAPRLKVSDVLGAPGTTYPTYSRVRRLALGPRQEDFIVLGADRRTVVIHLSTAAHLDQVRIITLAEQLGDDGCTPGYWKQDKHLDSWQVYQPGDSFETVFGADAFSGDETLISALELNGSGVNALARHAVAALLNAVNTDVAYPLTSAEVIEMTRDAIVAGGSAIETTKDVFDGYNNGGCPLD